MTGLAKCLDTRLFRVTSILGLDSCLIDQVGPTVVHLLGSLPVLVLWRPILGTYTCQTEEVPQAAELIAGAEAAGAKLEDAITIPLVGGRTGGITLARRAGPALQGDGVVAGRGDGGAADCRPGARGARCHRRYLDLCAATTA